MFLISGLTTKLGGGGSYRVIVTDIDGYIYILHCNYERVPRVGSVSRS